MAIKPLCLCAKGESAWSDSANVPSIQRCSGFLPRQFKPAVARQWLEHLAGNGFDGVVAKSLHDPYLSGERAMRKIKRIRSADCIVGGFRFASEGGVVGSLLLGLYGEDGLLHHVGFTSVFTYEDRQQLLAILKPYLGGSGFTGNAPRGPSRWSNERSTQWERLQPKLVVEVSYDHFSCGVFDMERNSSDGGQISVARTAPLISCRERKCMWNPSRNYLLHEFAGNMADLLLSDIDGTLVDSNALHADAWRRAFEHFGIQIGMDEAWRQIGKGGDQLIPVFLS